MKKIYSKNKNKKNKKNKDKEKNKYKLVQYWSILYPKEYVDALTSKTLDKKLTKLI